ncbi:hypothetical protein WK07_06270 [Burkholderia multivorans]|nr:hypothetical protein WK07_06270 [Burkholderia multivorans]
MRARAAAGRGCVAPRHAFAAFSAHGACIRAVSLAHNRRRRSAPALSQQILTQGGATRHALGSEPGVPPLRA